MADNIKTVSSDNLARFKQKCDETYAKIGEGGGGGKLYMHTIQFNAGGGAQSGIAGLTLYTSQSEPYDLASLGEFLPPNTNYYGVSGKMEGFTGDILIPYQIKHISEGNFSIYAYKMDAGGTFGYEISPVASITDENPIEV